MNAPDETTFDNGNIILEGHVDPRIREILESYDEKEFLRENPELVLSQRTGYPVLFYLIQWLFRKEWIKGKNFLEIGWGSIYGPRNLAFMRRITGTDSDCRNDIMSIDTRNPVEGMVDFDWGNIGTLPMKFDCIFHHRMSETKGGYEEVTDARLNTGWYYIAFRKIGATSTEPIDPNKLKKRWYHDCSFKYRNRDRQLWPHRGPEDIWYEVTILQKPSGTDGVRGGVHDSLKWIVEQ